MSIRFQVTNSNLPKPSNCRQVHDQTQHPMLTLLTDANGLRSWFHSNHRELSFDPVSAPPPGEIDLFMSVRTTTLEYQIVPSIATTSGAQWMLGSDFPSNATVWFGCSWRGCYATAAEYFADHPPGTAGHHSIAVQDPG